MVKHRAGTIGAMLLISSAALAQQQAGDAAAIARIHADWAAAINDGRYESPMAMSMWAPDLRGWAPGAAEDSYGREAEGLRKYMQAYPRHAARRPTFRFRIEETMVSGNLAFAHVLWTATDADGVEQPTMRSFEIWRKHADGSWRMSRYLESPESGQG